MRIFKEIKPLRDFVADNRRLERRLGLVPTMGALHRGHLSLLEASKAENDLTLCTLFVNPIQFNNPADLANYPATLDKDLEALQQAGCDTVFAPSAMEMYPTEPRISFDFGALSHVLEGAFRPGHFSGVALVVSKLFHLTEPDTVYFGQKDYQQFCIIRQLVHDLNFRVRLKCMPTIRESDGLAMSSRNMRLTPEQRKSATGIVTLLREGRHRLVSGDRWPVVQMELRKKSQAMSVISIDYLELADMRTLEILTEMREPDHSLLLIAGYVGAIRLIDNLRVSDSDLSVTP
jgi:pantoate--beta-alanine ligase